MQQSSNDDKEIDRVAARRRFAPAMEAQFRQSLRSRLRLTRSVMFAVIGVGYGLVPLYSRAIFGAGMEDWPGLRLLELAVVMPLLLITALATYQRLPAALVQPLQLGSTILALLAALILRFFALRGGPLYPAEMTGVILIAIAFFAGFTWRRVALAALLFSVLAAALEIMAQKPDGTPLAHVYSQFFMGVIAVLGSYVQERVTRLNWWDLTRLRSAQAALRESERRFEAFMDHTPAIAWIKDAGSRYLYRNKAHRDRYGEPGENWSGRTDADYFPPAPVSTYVDTDQQVLASGQPVEFETLNFSRDGSTNEWLVQKFRFGDGAGQYFVAGMGVDIGERNRLQQQLRESEARFQAFLDNSPTVSWMKDEEGRYLYVSQSFKQFLGVSDDSWRGRTDFDYFPEDFARQGRELDLQVLASGGASEVQGPAVSKDGLSRHWLLVRFVFTDHSGRRFIGGVATDVTVRKLAEDIVRLQSLTDEMTGLYNRRGFSLLADQQIQHARRQQLSCALLYADMDGLKRINEEHGHDGGDQALTSVSEALRVAVRSSDIVARIGGDEFVVFAIGCEDVQALKRRVLDAVGQYNRSESLPFKLSLSIGISEFQPGEGVSIETKMAEADLAMLAIKRARAA